jgi:hypothetical protein
MIARANFWCHLIAAVGAVSIGSAFGQSPSEPAKIIATGDACQHLLPAEVSRTLSEQFSGWIVQSSDRLSSSARVRWQAEKPLGCPGIAGGRFTSADTAFAVLVVGSGENNGQAKLLSVIRSDGAYHANVLEQISSGATNYFVHVAKVSQFLDAASARKFRVAATDSIVLFDAGTAEYGVEVYFWTGASFCHEPVDY